MIGRVHHVVVDCPDPQAEATFWSHLLGQPITYASDDFMVVAPDDHHSGLAFQRAPDHVAPVWGDPSAPQQLHLDVMTDDPDIAGAEVVALGARPLSPPGEHVYADPAGHPFCLIRRPGWAPPLDASRA
ncbi:VOC family protein [Pedococcus sp. 5OH_020]|uniref:VOC family protein n=1 Tax=Pedococcus sp. 5OH_020 TaxID=2989814 RepID=UPI0022E9DAE0|nr:VOC family protein [Pedococcus sp. 5OH_020]